MMLSWYLAAAAVIGSAIAALAGAAEFPAQPVRLVVPFPPGGVADSIARIVTQKVSAQMQAAIVVDNRPGASGIIGAEAVAKARPDGQTLLLANLPVMTINPLQFASLPYDPAQFTAVVMLADQPYIVAIHPSVPARTLTAFVELARREPDRFSYGTSSSSMFLATELLKKLGGFNMTHVPYKGAGPAVNDLLGGHISLIIGADITLAPHVKAGRLRGLALTAAKRSETVPELPTAAEAGIRGFEITSWQGVVGPAGMRAAAIDRFNAEFNIALKSADVQMQFRKQGVSSVGGTPAQFSRYVAEEAKRWGDIALEAKLAKETL
jgi:tripartite-type tricarboxylate transporter receptor subunit TctC